MNRSESLWMVLAACLLAAAFAACGDDDDDDLGDGDADADADADADGDGDADGDADADADGDADVGPCGGHESLTVRVTLTYLASSPLPEADVALDCGAARLEGVSDAAGEVVFEGLDLATTPVDVTAFHPDTNAVSLLGVHDAAEPVILDLSPLAPDVDPVIVAGDITQTEEGSMTIVAATNGGYFPFEDAYQMYLTEQESVRFTGFEYRPESDDTVTPLGWFDATVPMPVPEGGSAEGPVIVPAPTTFATADVAVSFVDERLSVREPPLDDSPLGYSTRHLLGVLVHDISDGEFAWNLVGVTTAVDTSGDTDTYSVSWPADAVSDPLTRIHVIDATGEVGVFGRTSGLPDTLGPIDAPEPAALLDVAVGEAMPIGSDPLVIDRPAWAEGPSLVALIPSNSLSLYGEGYTFAAYWVVRVEPGVDTVHFPAPPGGAEWSDVLGLSDLAVVVQVSNGVDDREGMSWVAVDARARAFVE